MAKQEDLLERLVNIYEEKYFRADDVDDYIGDEITLSNNQQGTIEVIVKSGFKVIVDEVYVDNIDGSSYQIIYHTLGKTIDDHQHKTVRPITENQKITIVIKNTSGSPQIYGYYIKQKGRRQVKIDG